MHFFFEKKDKSNADLIEEVILEKYNQYYRLAYSYVHNEDDASDIVQNGAYKALKSSHTLKQPEHAQTWVYRIMLNECFNYLKQPKFLSYEKLEEENELDLGSEKDHYGDIDLQNALDVLSQKDKAIIILKYFEEKTLEEIADILEENVNTIKSRLYRSIKKLRKILSEESEREKGEREYE